MATLREVTLIAVNDVNAGGVLLEDHLWDMPAWGRTVALSGVHHGATLALAMAQLRSSHDLHLLEPGFLVGTDEGEMEELTSDFTTTMVGIMVAMHAGDIVLTAFFESYIVSRVIAILMKG